MALPTPGVTPANWGAQINAEILKAQKRTFFGPPLIIGRYSQNGAAGGGNLSLNRIYATAFPISEDITIDRIAVNVTTGGSAGTVVRMGLFTDLGGMPDALITDFGTVAATTTGVKEITVNQAVGAGIAWFGACAQVGSNVGVEGISDLDLAAMFMTDTGNGIGGIRHYWLNGVAGAFPTGAAPGWTTGNDFNGMRMVIRRSA
jgi:hypothetical protein